MDNSIVPSDSPLPDGASVPVGPSVTGLPETEDNLPPLPPEIEEAPNPPSQPSAEDAQPIAGPIPAAKASSEDNFFLAAVALVAGAAFATFLPLLMPRSPRIQFILKSDKVRPAPLR